MKLIALEGLDFSGKSTSVATVKDWMMMNGEPYIETRQPGDTQFAERARKLVLYGSEEQSKEAEAFLFWAMMTDHISKKIRPYLETPINIICDRYISSSYAYQHAGLGMSSKSMEHFIEMGSFGIKADYTLYFDITLDTMYKRMVESGREMDNIERRGKKYYSMVKGKYDEMKKDFIVIDANVSEELVAIQVKTALNEIFYMDAKPASELL